MLETIREFGLDQLAASNDEAETRYRHAALVPEAGGTGRPELLGPEQRSWSERLETEHANLRAALSWLTVSGGPVQRSGWPARCGCSGSCVGTCAKAMTGSRKRRRLKVRPRRPIACSPLGGGHAGLEPG